MQFSFSCIDRLQRRGRDKREGNCRTEVVVSLDKNECLFWTAKLEELSEDDEDPPHPAYFRNHERLSWVDTQAKTERSADDIDIPISVALVERGDEGEQDVELDMGWELLVPDCTSSSDLCEAIERLSRESPPYFEALDALSKARQDLERLPDKMKELEMFATAQRLQDAGGTSLLLGLSGAVAAVLKGEEISGLHLAIPQTKHIMGTPDHNLADKAPVDDAVTPGEAPEAAAEQAVEETPAAEEAAEEVPTAESVTEEAPAESDAPAAE
jgi:hypothetical protein